MISKFSTAISVIIINYERLQSKNFQPFEDFENQ